MINIDFENINNKINEAKTIVYEGIVKEVIGLAIYVKGIKASIGEVCTVYNENNLAIQCEVVAFKNEYTTLMSLEDTMGIYPGCRVISSGKFLSVNCSNKLLGRVLDGLGRPLDNKNKIFTHKTYNLNNQPPNPLTRKTISEELETGIKAIDAFITCGKGQRMGIFSGSGVGKSTIISMLARNAKADVNVIALIGERGRELREFIENDLGEEGLKKSVIVCATSDTSPLTRVKGALTATAIAEYFRDQGKNVILFMDSVTRFAMAQREIGLTVGEPPTQKGYTPSVFSFLPKLVERTGTSDTGVITAFYTVLVDGDDFNEPIADTMRGLLDGHIILSRQLSHKNHYPPIDILSSLSRIMNNIIDEEHKATTNTIKEILAIYKENEDLISIGAYQRGSNKKVDNAINYYDSIMRYLKQDKNEYSSFYDTIRNLKKILG
ncbi:MAG: flagellar protein export ATPase FliI [Cetobacterium sp.]